MRRLAVALTLLCMSAAALGQTTYPTPAGSRVNGVVPLVCDTNGANCAPSGSSGVAANQVQGDVASGSTDSGNPVKVGSKAQASYVVAYSSGQRANLGSTLYGEVLVAPFGLITAADGWLNTRIGTAHNVDANNILPAYAGYVFNNTTWDRQRGDANGIAVQPGLSATGWNYTSGTTPILSNTTTAVTIQAAAGASVRNFIDSCQIATTAFGAAVPLAIRDGAGGTVLWANVVPTGGWLTPVNLIFQMPLRGTANTLLEIVTTTANTSGTVTANCQGHTGT